MKGDLSPPDLGSPQGPRDIAKYDLHVSLLTPASEVSFQHTLRMFSTKSSQLQHNIRTLGRP
jgi:hypothetical protein